MQSVSSINEKNYARFVIMFHSNFRNNFTIRANLYCGYNKLVISMHKIGHNSPAFVLKLFLC